MPTAATIVTTTIADGQRDFRAAGALGATGFLREGSTGLGLGAGMGGRVRPGPYCTGGSTSA